MEKIDSKDELTKQEKAFEAIRKVREEEAKLSKAMLAIRYESVSSSAYLEMDSYVEMVTKDCSTGLLIEGPAGVGKTYRTIQLVNKEVGADQMAYTDSFTTPAAFYIWLYENKDKKVLILDDVAGLMNNNKCLAMLKGALWEVNKKRIVSYLTTKPLKDEYGEDVPGRFDLEAGIIVLTNYLDRKSPHVQAVLSRINHCRLNVPREELRKVMRQIANKNYKSLTATERTEALAYLTEQADSTGKEFNLRTLIKAFQFREFSKQIADPILWKTLVSKSLEKKDDMLVLEAIFSDPNLRTELEREARFSEITGLDKRTYFRHKKIYEAKYGKVEATKPLPGGSSDAEVQAEADGKDAEANSK